MKRCNTCDAFILFGGVRQGPWIYCDARCRERGTQERLSHDFPAGQVEQVADEIHEGYCPSCSRRGPIDVHMSYFVWSALFITRWHSTPHVCCRRCGFRKQTISLLGSFCLGWWGIYGLVVTPAQLLSNLWAMRFPPDPIQPSEMLMRMARLELAKGADPAPQDTVPSTVGA
jgi:hypothetical protein